MEGSVFPPSVHYKCFLMKANYNFMTVSSFWLFFVYKAVLETGVLDLSREKRRAMPTKETLPELF